MHFSWAKTPFPGQSECFVALLLTLFDSYWRCFLFEWILQFNVFMHVFNVFYKSEKNMFLCFFYVQSNVSNIYDKNIRSKDEDERRTYRLSWSSRILEDFPRGQQQGVSDRDWLNYMNIIVIAHTTDADATQLSSWVALTSAVCIQFETTVVSSRRIWSKNWKLNMLRILPVELAAELEIGPQLPTGELCLHSARHNSTRLNMFSFQHWHSQRGPEGPSPPGNEKKISKL